MKRTNLAAVVAVLAMAAGALTLVTSNTMPAAAETPAERCKRETNEYNQNWENIWRATHPGDPGPPPPPPVPTSATTRARPPHHRRPPRHPDRPRRPPPPRPPPRHPPDLPPVTHQPTTRRAPHRRCHLDRSPSPASQDRDRSPAIPPLVTIRSRDRCGSSTRHDRTEDWRFRHGGGCAGSDRSAPGEGRIPGSSRGLRDPRVRNRQGLLGRGVRCRHRQSLSKSDSPEIRYRACQCIP